MTNAFDPSRYLRKLGSGDYLEVKWRLLWLRTEHPDAVIETELAHLEEDPPAAIFRARVSIPGGGSATGWGQEERKDFVDYLEKAETKALGRALAALGYGTQFCEDFDFAGGDHGRGAGAAVVARTATIELPPGATFTGESVAGQRIYRYNDVTFTAIETAKGPRFQTTARCQRHTDERGRGHPWFARLENGKLSSWSFKLPDGGSCALSADLMHR